MNTISQITVEEVKSALDSKEDMILLDVRTPGEYSRGKIEGSINVPVDSLESAIDMLPDKNRKVIAYCLSGSRSDMAVQILRQMGYTHVFSMTHGLLEWRAKKYPLVA
jgi:rhodanese-related sulfurtransferase